MGIILFLVDTSASMNQRTCFGTSYLDVAKGAIDTFMKYRTRDPASRGDRYMLVSFDEQPNAVKAGWKENHAAFISELKNLQATSLSSFGQALKESFDLLNIHRLHTSIDHYGLGRNPFYLEPAVVIVLTDGGRLNNPNDIERELSIPVDNSPEGSELSKQPFRWDQRLFTVLLRIPGLEAAVGGIHGNREGNLSNETLRLAEHSISSMSEATGGKSYVVSTQKSLVQCMESLTLKLHPGVVINWKRIGGAPASGTNNGSREGASPGPVAMEIDQPSEEKSLNSVNHPAVVEGENGVTPPSGNGTTTWHDVRKMIFVRPKTTGFWPIPESFWPDAATQVLSPRDVPPVVWFNTSDTPPLLVENFPFDKYELEPSPLTQFILQKRNPNICWQVFVNNSGKQDGLRYPFGYLKASSGLTHVTLFVMPFNYPTLLPLIEELQKQRMRPSPKWRIDFDSYLDSVPLYYAQPLRNALRLMGAPTNVVPDRFDGQLSYMVSNYLRRLKKQAKMESERVISTISKTRATEAARKGNGIADLGMGISIAIGSTQVEESFRNPFEISRAQLLRQLERMRTNFLHKTPTTPNLIDEVSRHKIPISQMGNYQEHLKRINPLRELDSGSVRTQLFGNPFKLERSDNKQRDADIFADEHMVEMNNKRIPFGKKRNRFSRSPSPASPRSPNPPNSTSNSSPSSLPTPPPTPPPTSLGTEKSTPLVTTEKKQQLDSNTGNKTADAFKAQKLPPPVSRGQLSDACVDVKLERETTKDRILPEPAREAVGNSLKSLAPPILSESVRQNTKSPVDKVQLVSRKRERTPSPTTPIAVPPPKRPALGAVNDRDGTPSLAKVKLASQTSLKASQNHTVSRELSPISGLLPSRLSKPEVSSASKVLNEEIQKQQGQENARLRALIVKEVRKPGKNYNTLFQHLEGVRGTVEARKVFVHDIVKEAGKFKRKLLIQQLEDWAAKLASLRAGGAIGGSGNEQKSAGKLKGTQKR